jgi:hypothetical protein
MYINKLTVWKTNMRIFVPTRTPNIDLLWVFHVGKNNIVTSKAMRNANHKKDPILMKTVLFTLVNPVTFASISLSMVNPVTFASISLSMQSL